MLDKPLSTTERHNAFDMLRGCCNRICVTDDPKELINLIGSAHYYVNLLAQSRILQLSEEVSSDE